jgi:hypothetical protein
MKLHVAAGVEARLLAGGTASCVLVGCSSPDSLWVLQALPAPKSDEGLQIGRCLRAIAS